MVNLTFPVIKSNGIDRNLYKCASLLLYEAWLPPPTNHPLGLSKEKGLKMPSLQESLYMWFICELQMAFVAYTLLFICLGWNSLHHMLFLPPICTKMAFCICSQTGTRWTMISLSRARILSCSLDCTTLFSSEPYCMCHGNGISGILWKHVAEEDTMKTSNSVGDFTPTPT